MKKQRNRGLSTHWVWLFMYISIWFIFGCTYCYIANVSSGGDFVFQEDILVKSKNIAFQKQVGINMDYDVTKKLITNYKEDFIPLKMVDGDTNLITFNYNSNGYDSIGNDWAKYYLLKLQMQGYNFFKYSIINREDPTIANGKYTKVRLNFYKASKNAGKKILPNQLSPKKYFIWIDNDFFGQDDTMDSMLSGENKYEEMKSVKPMLSSSINYLDNDINIIYNYETNKNFRYPLVDFLYFSAVTITTLGYGDILPNSSLVRGIVMVEMILGVITIAVFISSFYDWLKGRAKE